MTLTLSGDINIPLAESSIANNVGSPSTSLMDTITTTSESPAEPPPSVTFPSPAPAPAPAPSLVSSHQPMLANTLTTYTPLQHLLQDMEMHDRFILIAAWRVI